jgi:hypothetical protein
MIIHEKRTGCFWERYQATGQYKDLTRWLKHRAYVRALRLCLESED